MTAVLTGDLDDLRDADADLVRGSLAGDRAAFAQIYDRYADRLHDFCLRMLRDRDGAADCVQEAFCVAATRLPQLREPDKLRPWLYAIARTEALARLRERRRETPFDELPDIESHDPTPDTLAARTELADLISKAAGGLSDRDRVVFDLAFHHGLSGPDLAEALDISHANANKIVLRLRRTVERSLGALLLSRRVKSTPGGCAELGEILAGWDGQFTVLMRKRIARHIESCPPCDDEQRRSVNPAALLGTTPIFIAAPDWVRERTLSDVQLTCQGSSMEGESGDDGPLFAADAEAVSAADAGARRRNRRWLWATVFLMAVLGASAGLTFAWSPQGPVTITETEVSGTGPEPSGQTPTPSNILPTPIILHTPTIVPTPIPQPPPQVSVVHTPIEPRPAGPPRMDEQTPVSEPEPEPDVRLPRRFTPTQTDRELAPKKARSPQRSSATDGPPPSEARTALRPAPVSESDPKPNSSTPRQRSGNAGASEAGSPERRGTGR